MFAKLVFLLLVGALALEGSPIGPRIVNGTDAQDGEFPYIISLRLFDSHNCGGSILTNEFILTAAHCVSGYPADFLSVQYGVTDITSGTAAPNLVKVAKAIPHPNYVPGYGYLNDVAVVKLATPLTFGFTVQSTNLPKALNATPENAQAELIGWGLPYTGGGLMPHLQKVSILIYPDDECESIHKVTGPTNREYHVCAGVPEGGKGQCNGDSGGPLTVDGVQVGIVSWSVKPCTVKGYPGVFTKVSKHVSWILEQIANN